MDGMTTRSRLAALVLAAIAALAAAACGGDGAGEDKAGGSGKPVTLRLANTNGQLSFTPAVDYFAQRVGELSGGDLRIQSVDEWANSATEAERQVVHDVSVGEVDLGWVGTRVFDTLGVESFQALTAPMLVDSYALQEAVIESGITEQMLQKLDELGVVGLGVLPDGLRKPVGVSGPIADPADWKGIAFGTLRSDGHAEAIRALGATPVQVGWMEREERLKNGTLQGFETSIWIHHHNPALVYLAPYVTANVNLWPQMDVLLADPARLEALSAEQREWLEQAARDAAARSAAVADKDFTALSKSCAAGARFAEASAADLAALEAAFAPVYANLEQHPETKAFIERIRALKESTTPEPVLAVPAECTGQAPKQASGSTRTVPADLNGTYRFVLTKEDARKAGETDLSGLPRTGTWILNDGRFDAPGGFHGSYSVDGDRITFEPVGDYTTTFTFTVDDEGNIDLDPVPPVDAGAAFEIGSHTIWTKIDGGTAPKQADDRTESAPKYLNGTYRYVLTKDGARAAFPDAPDLDNYPEVSTWTLKDGRYSNPGGLSGTYSVDGNRIIFDVPDFGYALAFTFRVDELGNLHLKPVLPMERGDRFVWSSKVWKKLD